MTIGGATQKLKRKRITFQIQTDPGSEVFLAGSFNNWELTGKKLRDRQGTGKYTGARVLPKGRHEYKFVVNGAWVIDPTNPEWTVNDHGSLNSVLTVA